MEEVDLGVASEAGDVDEVDAISDESNSLSLNLLIHLKSVLPIPSTW